MENKNHTRKKWENKNFLKQKNNKQIEEEKELKSQQEIGQPKIFNLSKKTLPRYQSNILLRGWKFISTPKRDIIQLKLDIHNYTQKLRWTEFFHNAPENNDLQNLFKTKSNFTPSRNRDRGLDHQTDILNNLYLEGINICSRYNLSKMEQSELPKFINYRTIIIKPANKGVAVAVLSTTHYKAMIIQDLDDANTYKKLK